MWQKVSENKQIYSCLSFLKNTEGCVTTKYSGFLVLLHIQHHNIIQYYSIIKATNYCVQSNAWGGLGLSKGPNCSARQQNVPAWLCLPVAT